MIKGGVGGANTNRTGLKFEKDTDIKDSIKNVNGYTIKDEEIYFKDKKVAEIYSKYRLYKVLLPKLNIDWTKRVSAKLLPDEAIFIIKDSTLFIIEKKMQTGTGSVDEKLQTCDFKKKKYEKLLEGTNIKVEVAFVLSDWFKSPKYKDSLDYIKSVNCHYFFNVLPLEFLGLAN
jgi:hypothetical protein